MVEPKYGLRKLSVGLCSVLLGTTVMLVNTVHADSNTTSDVENVDVVANTQRPCQEDQVQINAGNDQSQQTIDNKQRSANDSQQMVAGKQQSANAHANTLTVDHSQSFSSSQTLTESKQSSDGLTSADFDNSDGQVVKTTAGWTSHAQDYDSIAKSVVKLNGSDSLTQISPADAIWRSLTIHSELDGSKLKVGNRYLLASVMLASKDFNDLQGLILGTGSFGSQSLEMRTFTLFADDKKVAVGHLYQDLHKHELDFVFYIDKLFMNDPVKSVILDYSNNNIASLTANNNCVDGYSNVDFSKCKSWIGKSFKLVTTDTVQPFVFVARKSSYYQGMYNWSGFRNDTAYNAYGVNANFAKSDQSGTWPKIYNVKNSAGFSNPPSPSGMAFITAPMQLSDGHWVDAFSYNWDVIPGYQLVANLGDNHTADYLQEHLPKGGGWVYSKQSDGSYNVGFNFSLKAINDRILHDPDLRNKLLRSYVANFDTDDPEKFADDNISRLKEHPYISELQLWLVISSKDMTKPFVVTMTDLTPGTTKMPISISTHGLPNISSSGVLYHHTLLKMLDDTNTQVGGTDYLQAVPGEQSTYSITVPAGYHLANQQVNGSYYTIDGTSVKYTLGDQAKMDAEPIVVHLVRNDYANSYHFVDDDNDDVTVGSAVSFSGKMGQIVKLPIVAPENYQVVGKLPTEYAFNTDNQPLVIHLKHQHQDATWTDVHGRQENEYRVIEDLPDGSRPVILDCIIVNHRDADKDLVTGKITYGKFESNNSEQKIKIRDGEWSQGSYVSDLPVDKVAGYNDSINDYVSSETASNTLYMLTFCREGKRYVFDYLGDAPDPKTGISPNLTYDVIPSSRDFHIKYDQATEPILLKYYDLNGNVVDSKMAYGKYLTRYTADDSIVPEGYQIASGQNRTITVSWDTNELDLLVVQQLKFVSYTSGDIDLNRYIIRYITVKLPNGNLQQIKQQVQFVRDRWDNVLDPSVHEYTSWRSLTTNELPAYVPVKKDGYTIDMVPAKVVTPDMGNLDPVSLTYQLVSKPQPPKYIDVNGNTYNNFPDHYVVADGQDSNASGQLIVKPISISTPSKPKMLTRIINIMMPGGHSRTIRQQVMAGTNFSQVHLPHLRGYHVVITNDTGSHKTNLVNGFTLASVFADQNVTVNISFAK